VGGITDGGGALALRLFTTTFCNGTVGEAELAVGKRGSFFAKIPENQLI